MLTGLSRNGLLALWLGQLGQLGQGETIRACASAADFGKGVRFLSSRKSPSKMTLRVTFSRDDREIVSHVNGKRQRMNLFHVTKSSLYLCFTVYNFDPKISSFTLILSITAVSKKIDSRRSPSPLSCST